MAQLEALGPPRVPIVPNGFHRRDAAFYKTRYPDLLVVCPAAARKKAGQAVAVDGAAERLLPPLGIVCHEPAGVKPFRVGLRIAARGRAGPGVGGSAFQSGACAWAAGVGLLSDREFGVFRNVANRALDDSETAGRISPLAGNDGRFARADRPVPRPWKTVTRWVCGQPAPGRRQDRLA